MARVTTGPPVCSDGWPRRKLRGTAARAGRRYRCGRLTFMAGAPGLHVARGRYSSPKHRGPAFLQHFGRQTNRIGIGQRTWEQRAPCNLNQSEDESRADADTNRQQRAITVCVSPYTQRKPAGNSAGTPAIHPESRRALLLAFSTGSEAQHESPRHWRSPDAPRNRLILRTHPKDTGEERWRYVTVQTFRLLCADAAGKRSPADYGEPTRASVARAAADSRPSAILSVARQRQPRQTRRCRIWP